jgi:hypothetical protein
MHDSSLSQVAPIKSGLEESKFFRLDEKKAVGTFAILPAQRFSEPKHTTAGAVIVAFSLPP